MRPAALEEAVVSLRVEEPLLVEARSLEAVINIGGEDEKSLSLTMERSREYRFPGSGAYRLSQMCRLHQAQNSSLVGNGKKPPEYMSRIPYFLMKSPKYRSKNFPEYRNPAAVERPEPAPITIASDVRIALLRDSMLSGSLSVSAVLSCLVMVILLSCLGTCSLAAGRGGCVQLRMHSVSR